MKQEKGITLVALIITIIVLIILAAVTIIAVKDSNLVGIATKGTEDYSAAQVEESQKIEELATYLEDAVSNIVSLGANGSGGSTGGGDGSGGGNEGGGTEEPDEPLVTPEGKLTVAGAKAAVAKDGLGAHIGEEVAYSPEGGGTWRIFYYDNEDGPDGKGYFGDGKGTLYLKRDYDKNLKTTLTLITEEESNDGLATMKKMNPMWAESTYASALDQNNEKAVAWLCDPANWGQFVTGQANYAVGAPSIELLVRAWNADHEQKEQVSLTNSGGLYKNSPSGNPVFYRSTLGLWNYEPTGWRIILATPVPKSEITLWVVTYDDGQTLRFGDENFTDALYNVTPVVALKM